MLITNFPRVKCPVVNFSPKRWVLSFCRIQKAKHIKHCNWELEPYMHYFYAKKFHHIY